MLEMVLPYEGLTKQEEFSACGIVPIALASVLTAHRNQSSSDHKAPLVKAQSSVHLGVDKPQSNTHPKSCISHVMMSDRQMSASHPWEVKNCS